MFKYILTFYDCNNKKLSSQEYATRQEALDVQASTKLHTTIKMKMKICWPAMLSLIKQKAI